MAEGTRYKQMKNEVCTQVFVVMQEFTKEFRSRMDFLESKLCNNLRISIRDEVANYKEECNHTRIQQTTHIRIIKIGLSRSVDWNYAHPILYLLI